jgi:site-specific DNA recombinase
MAEKTFVIDGSEKNEVKAAIYARYSTDMQREQSLDDQFRVCERIAERHGFTVVARYKDAAISGGTTQRPGYQSILTDARAKKFDVIVAEDTSRLWRNMAEQAPRLAELSDIGIHIVTHDIDTRQESAAILGAVGGAMAETYRREIARRTRRGLEGLARNSKPTGGKAFGYFAAVDSESGDREVNPAEAAIVLRVFELYAAGKSAKRIAGILNAERVPSPGASWARSSRRATSWRASAIAGNPERGIGILNNELYVGRVVWNRFRWIRSASDSKKRRYVLNPRDEWITRTDERLRIVSDELWQRAKARQRDQTEAIGVRVAQGLSKGAAMRTGKRGQFLFSGLLKCGHCGTNLQMANATRYQCAAYLNGRACSNNASVSRAVVEAGLLEGIKRELLKPDVVEEARRRIVSALRTAKRTAPQSPERANALRQEIANITEAIATGALKSSKALAARLVDSERELEMLEAAQTESTVNVEALTPGIVGRYTAAVESLAATLMAADVDSSRAELRRLIGDIDVTADEKEIHFRTKEGAVEYALSRLAGNAKSVCLVAGVGFEPTTFGL